MSMFKKCLVFLLFISLMPISAQDFQSYFEEFDVVLYQLQVNVRDRDGNHIPGLTKADFQLLLEGDAQALESVQEYSASDWLDQPDKPIPQQARRLFVFLFDMKYTTKQGLLASRDAAKRFILNDMLPTDLISVFTFNPLSGISLVTNFTSDREHLLQAVEYLGLADVKNVVQGPSGYFFNGRIDVLATELSSTTNFGIAENDSVPAGGGDQLGVDPQIDMLEHLIEIAEMGRRAEQKIYQREVSGFLNSFEKFADGLRLIRGRKNLMWFSTGFDARSIVGATTEEIQRNQRFIESGQHYNVSTDQFGSTNIQHEAQELIDHLQSSGTVIFSVDTALSGESSFNKEGIQSLNMLAEDTGGKAFTNFSDLDKPFARVKDLTNDYYVLSFYPEIDLPKGEVARVRVKVPGKRGVKVYTTKGIMVEPDFRNLSKIEKQIHLSEYIGRDHIVSGIPMQIETFQVPVGDGLVKLTVSVELRGDYFLGFSPKETHPIEIHTLAVSKESNGLFDRDYFQFSLKPEMVKDTLETTGVKYFANVFLKEGEYKLKVVARDLFNGKVGSNIEFIQIENKLDQLFGPTLITGEKWVMLREDEDRLRERRVELLDYSYPFTVRGRSLVPSATPVISGSGTEKFFYLISGDASMRTNAPNVTALLMDGEGKIIPIPVDAMNADAEFKGGPRNVMHFLLDVNFDRLGLKSGENYQLMTQFKTKGGVALRTAAEFMVE